MLNSGPMRPVIKNWGGERQREIPDRYPSLASSSMYRHHTHKWRMKTEVVTGGPVFQISAKRNVLVLGINPRTIPKIIKDSTTEIYSKPVF